MMNYVISFIFVFCLAKGYSQDTHKFQPDYFSIGYFGEKVFHPGLTGSLGFVSYFGKDTLAIYNSIDFGLTMTGYVHSDNHVGIFIKPQLSYYHIFGKSLELGLKTETGYGRRFYQGETFELMEDNTVVKVPLAAQNAFIYGAYFSLGQNFWVKLNRNIRWFIELGAFWEYPYNGYMLLHPSVSFGISKKFKK